jgi:hypothetical protein
LRTSNQSQSEGKKKCSHLFEEKIMNNLGESDMTDEEWLNQGKADAWAGRPKQPPSHDSLAASMYDLGYSEGQIKRSPIAIA